MTQGLSVAGPFVTALDCFLKSFQVTSPLRPPLSKILHMLQPLYIIQGWARAESKSTLLNHGCLTWLRSAISTFSQWRLTGAEGGGGVGVGGDKEPLKSSETTP